MDIKTHIFDDKEELKNWLMFLSSDRRNNCVKTDYRKRVEEKHIDDLMKIIKEIDRRGFNTFKGKHLKGGVIRHKDRYDNLSEYSYGTLGYYLRKLKACNLLKIRTDYGTSRATTYEKNFDTIEEAFGVLNDRLE